MNPIPDWVKTGCLVFALIVASILVLGGLLAMCSASIALPNFLEAQSRAMTARVQSDIRSISTALEKYKTDHGQYPPWSVTNPPITTPVAYMNQLPADSFAPKGASGEAALIKFYTTESDYVIWSVGPDKESQISGAADLDGSYEELQLKSYDATNGTTSPGDIFRTTLGP